MACAISGRGRGKPLGDVRNLVEGDFLPVLLLYVKAGNPSGLVDVFRLPAAGLACNVLKYDFRLYDFVVGRGRHVHVVTPDTGTAAFQTALCFPYFFV